MLQTPRGRGVAVQVKITANPLEAVGNPTAEDSSSELGVIEGSLASIFCHSMEQNPGGVNHSNPSPTPLFPPTCSYPERPVTPNEHKDVQHVRICSKRDPIGPPGTRDSKRESRHQPSQLRAEREENQTEDTGLRASEMREEQSSSTSTQRKSSSEDDPLVELLYRVLQPDKTKQATNTKVEPKTRVVFGLANVSLWGPTVEGQFGVSMAKTDIVCLAEHRVVATKYEEAKGQWGKAGFMHFSAPAMVTDRGDTSAGTAVLIKHQLGSHEPIVEHTAIVQDPRFSAAVLHCRGFEVLVISVYFHTGEGMSPKNVALLIQIVKIMTLLGHATIIGGDFNMPPEEVLGSTVLSGLRLKLVDPVDSSHAATCRPNESSSSYIDYALISEALYPICSRAETSWDRPWPTHAFVSFSLDARPAQNHVLNLRKPKPIPPPSSDGVEFVLGPNPNISRNL